MKYKITWIAWFNIIMLYYRLNMPLIRNKASASHKCIFGSARLARYLISDLIGTLYSLIKYNVYWEEKADYYGFEEIYWRTEKSMSRFSTSCSRNLFGCNERDVSLLGSPQRLVGAERLAWYWSTFSTALLPSPLSHGPAEPPHLRAKQRAGVT